MKIIEPLINELKDTLEEFEIKEDIDFKISNIEGFDYQINNLVKHQKNKDIRENIKKFEKILANNKVVDKFEITKNYFINIRINLVSSDKFFSDIANNLKNKYTKIF